MDKQDQDRLNTEQKIYEAAKKVFQRKGWAGARMQEIADEAGINKALLHYYFRSKDKLFKAVLKELMGKVLPQLLDVLNGNYDLDTKVKLITERYFDLLLENPQLPIFVMNELKNNPQQFPEELGIKSLFHFEVLERQLQEEYESGNIRKVEPFHFIMNIISLCIFPFIGKPMFMNLFELDENAYYQKLLERKEIIPGLIMQGIRT